MPTSTPWTRTPLEIWQEILKLTISLPLFFSTNPGPKDLGVRGEFTDTSIYWEAERTRNALRRVNKSWDTYLRRFDHRFVDLVDVEHGDIPLDAIRSAIRIRSLCCRCTRRVVDLVQLGDTLDQVHEDGTVEPWKLQILVLINAGVDSVGRNRQLPRPYERPHRVANLRVFLGEKDVPGLWDVVNGVGFPLTVSSGIPHNGSNLTALSWKVYDSVSVPDTPQLRHLKIWVRPSNMDEFTAYLGKIGTQLESLFCVFGLRMAGDYIDIWRLCPNLKYLRIRGHPEPVMPPTPGHPIELLSIFHFGRAHLWTVYVLLMRKRT
ncbi:SubName: Full=Uncharacterized protein {ECO:0000313/EMBL:CCA75169.1} [Serendipita indica DSM 11827]|nr:SubName: Full=Uncharacterized protein {ECO:0000313/EMBL:CCA75169.1} [Serendipita indica DSM 11827]